VRGGDLVFVSGLLGYDSARARVVTRTTDLEVSAAERVTHALAGLQIQTHRQLAAAAQTQSILDQLRLVLQSVDSDLRSLLKITVYLRDMSDFPFVRQVLRAALANDPPAISVIAVQDLPLRDARVQIEAVAL
jgi:enamine deaminase RidA (YjgF/YER057c/UK114 family)